MVIDDIIVNKSEFLKHCLKRINDEYAGNPDSLANETKIDAITLNLQRACEVCIDLAMHTIKQKKLSIPQTSREAFDILESSNIISQELSGSLKKMVGFRNIAIHEYDKLNPAVLRQIIEHHLGDFTKFVGTVKKA